MMGGRIRFAGSPTHAAFAGLLASALAGMCAWCCTVEAAGPPAMVGRAGTHFSTHSGILPGTTGIPFYGPKYSTPFPAAGSVAPGVAAYPPYAPLYHPSHQFYQTYRPSYVAPYFDFGYGAFPPGLGAYSSRATIIYATPMAPEATEHYSTQSHLTPHHVRPPAVSNGLAGATSETPAPGSTPSSAGAGDSLQDVYPKDLRPGMVLPDGSVIRSVGPLRQFDKTPTQNEQPSHDEQPDTTTPSETIPAPQVGPSR